MNKPVVLSEKTYADAEKLARESGFDSIEAYLDSLVDRARDNADLPDRMWEKIEEGVVSGNAGPMTREKLRRLADEGIARALPKK